jgi:hypothetical protein
MICRSMELTWQSTVRGSESSWDLGSGRLRGQVSSRTIHTEHIEGVRSMNGFVVDPQNCGSDEDGVLTKSKQREGASDKRGNGMSL